MESWQTELERGRGDVAWDRFIERYRRLIIATSRRFLSDGDDVMDAFTHVCQALRTDDLRRLRAFSPTTEHPARFSTWLVVVVRNLVIDWIRARDGRRRPSVAAADLTPLQQRIYELVFLQAHGHTEAYERIRSRDHPELRFSEYLRDLRVVYAALARGHDRPTLPGPTSRRDEHRILLDPRGEAEADPAAIAEMRRALDAAMADLATVERAAVQLYVVEGMAADDVARLLDLPNAKAVYNRVYRTLAALRERLESAGFERASF